MTQVNTVSIREDLKDMRDKLAEEYADRICNTLESADARARSFKAGFDSGCSAALPDGSVVLIGEEFEKVRDFINWEHDSWNEHSDCHACRMLAILDAAKERANQALLDALEGKS